MLWSKKDFLSGLGRQWRPATILTLVGLILAAASAWAKPVAYRDSEGKWHLIESSTWQQVKPQTKGSFRLQGAGAITFNVAYKDVANHNGIGFDDPTLGATRRATVESILTYLNSILRETGTCDIEFQVSTNIGSDTLAYASTYYDNSTTFHPGYAFNHITTNIDPDPSVPDIFVTMDFGYNWNSTTNPVQPSQFDMVTVLLHEITHGLGFASMTQADGTSSFPHDTVYTVFDNHLYTSGGTKLWNASGVFNSAALASLTGGPGAILFHGTSTNTAFGSNPPIYTPASFAPGSSMAHWDNGIIPTPVMTYSETNGVEKRHYQPFEIETLVDLGYHLRTNAAKHWRFFE